MTVEQVDWLAVCDGLEGVIVIVFRVACVSVFECAPTFEIPNFFEIPCDKECDKLFWFI